MAIKANSATKPNEPECLEKLQYEDLKATKGRGKGGGKGMSFHNVSLNSHQLEFLLLPFGEYTLVPWRPSVYQGDGTENRVNIQFRITENQRAVLEHIEEIIREQLEIPASMWNAATKPDADGGIFKAKVNLQGQKACEVTGITDQMPANWPQNCNAYIRLSCVYQQARAAGLLYEVVALDVGPPPMDTVSKNPFRR